MSGAGRGDGEGGAVTLGVQAEVVLLLVAGRVLLHRLLGLQVLLPVNMHNAVSLGSTTCRYWKHLSFYSSCARSNLYAQAGTNISQLMPFPSA